MKSTRPLKEALELCAFCDEVATYSEVFDNIDILDNSSQSFAIEPLVFCSEECHTKYYQYSLQRTRELEYDHRVRVFYTRMLLSPGPGKERLNETWRLFWKGTGEHLIGDIQYGIMVRIIETFVNSYTRLIRPSLLDFYDTDDRQFLTSAILAGRNLLYILGQHFYYKNPIHIENLCSVHIIDGLVYLLRGDGVILTETEYNREKLFLPMPGINDVVLLAHSRECLVAIRSDGSLWGYGNFYCVDMLTGDFSPQTYYYTGFFRKIVTADNDNISVAAALNYVIIVKTDGSLWVAGDTKWTKPSQRDIYVSDEESDSSIEDKSSQSASSSSSSSDSSSNSSYDNSSDSSVKETAMSLYKFVQIPLSGNKRVLYVTCHFDKAYIVKEDSTIWVIDTVKGKVKEVDINSRIHPDLLSDVESENIMMLKTGIKRDHYFKECKGITSYCYALDTIEMFMTKSGEVYSNGDDHHGELGGKSFNAQRGFWKRVEYQERLRFFYQPQHKRRQLLGPDDL